MKTLRFLGVALFAVLLNFCLSGCSKGDDDNSGPKNWTCVFTLNDQNFKAGDTIHVVDKCSKYRLIWQDAKGEVDVTNCQIDDYDLDIIYGDSQYMNIFEFRISGLGKTKVTLHDYNTNQDFFFYLVVDPIDLKEHFEITGPTSDYLVNDRLLDGPFICLRLSKEINEFREDGYVKIKTFGTNRGMKAASTGSSGNGYWVTNYKTVSWNSELGIGSAVEDGKTYVGKTTTKNVTYWAFTLDYRDQTHEIRRYGDSKVFLWDGEWDDK